MKTTRSAKWWALLRDRTQKKGLYDSAAYWDSKAEAFEGLARSNWPSNSYNACMHARQMREVDRIFDDVRGLAVADIGCGTGRASTHLALRGARVTGFDFAASALSAASREATARGLEIDFRQQDVFAPPPLELQGTFDRALTIGCLAIACSTEENFARAIDHVQKLLRSGGQVLFMEPIHRSRLLRRILRLGIPEWIATCEASGLRLVSRGNLFFVPARYLLAFRDLPPSLVNPVFDAGEKVLDMSAALGPLADYKWLLFEKRA